MPILIGADIVPTEANKMSFVSGDVNSIIGEELSNILQNADFRIFNLECPLVDVDNPILKQGPLLKAETSTINGIKSLYPNLLTLANNHVMDQGELGLFSTIEILKKEKIQYIGVGKNLNESSKAVLFSFKEKRIGVYACVEHEFSIAGEKNAGANPFDPLESFDHVASLKKQTDYVIVLYHGGKEHYRYPSPMLQKVCHKFVEKGADLVVCQHSHCIGCEEKYLNSTIVYGQGNFIFNTCDGPTAQTSLLVKIDDNLKISYVPLEKYVNGVRLASGESAEKIMNEFYNRGENIKREGFVDAEYNKFAKQNIIGYLLTCSGYYHSPLKRIVNRLCKYGLTSFFAKNAFSKNDLTAIRNFIECESHRELWIQGLKNEK
jgi:poly-gamma-glutamate synthesis protein (capsule biosynthesis protein)